MPQATHESLAAARAAKRAKLSQSVKVGWAKRSLRIAEAQLSNAMLDLDTANATGKGAEFISTRRRMVDRAQEKRDKCFSKLQELLNVKS